MRRYKKKLDSLILMTDSPRLVTFLESLDGIEWIHVIQNALSKENPDNELVQVLLNKESSDIKIDLSVLINLMSRRYQNHIPDAIHSVILRNEQNTDLVVRSIDLARLCDQELNENYVRTGILNSENDPEVRVSLIRYKVRMDRNRDSLDDYWIENFATIQQIPGALPALFIALHRHKPIEALTLFQNKTEDDMGDITLQVKKTIRRCIKSDLMYLCDDSFPPMVSELAKSILKDQEIGNEELDRLSEYYQSGKPTENLKKALNEQL